jgi:phage terminase large subunit-like protein
MKTTEKPSEALERVSDGLKGSEQGKDRDTDLQIPLMGVQTPRIHTPLNDLPSLGHELIDLAASLGVDLMEWQKFALIHSHKVKPDGRWATPQNIFCVARQNGKSFLQQIRILGGLFLWDEPLQIGQAHTLNTSLEQFRQMMWTIEANDFLAKQVKKVRLNHGAEEIETMRGTRFMVRAGGSAARGISRPSTIHLDELLRMNNMDSYASLRYTLMASPNPMLMGYSNAGDNTSVVLNSFRDRALAAIGGVDDNIGYFEWSSPTDEISVENARYANPAMGVTIHEDNIRSVLNDPPNVVMSEVLCRWVVAIQNIVDVTAWNKCLDKTVDLDTEKLTWLAIDFSPDKKHASLVGAQKLPNDKFIVKLLHSWSNDLHLDDREIANELADYARKYPTEYVLYSRKSAGAVASRLAPAGIPVFDMDGAYPQSCDEMLSAINSGRLKHRGQSQLTEEILAAVQLRRGDAGWVIGRRASNAVVCGAVATALVTHFATRPDNDLDIMVG